MDPTQTPSAGGAASAGIAAPAARTMSAAPRAEFDADADIVRLPDPLLSLVTTRSLRREADHMDPLPALQYSHAAASPPAAARRVTAL